MIRLATWHPACALLLAAVACLAPCQSHAWSDGTIQDKNKACTMKLTDQEDGRFLVGIICEKRKILSYWMCPEVERLAFTPFECVEQETQSVDPVHGKQIISTGRVMRIFAPSKDRVPFVLCGRLCDPTQ
jgi:hypothetical protein